MTAKTGTISRDAATRRVMKAVAHTFSHEPLPFALEDGTRPVVVALANDYISDIVGRVASMGGEANVAVAFSGHFQTIIFSKTTSDSQHVMEINQDLSMGMFLIKLSNNPGKTVRLRFRDVDADVPSFTNEMAYA